MLSIHTRLETTRSAIDKLDSSDTDGAASGTLVSGNVDDGLVDPDLVFDNFGASTGTTGGGGGGGGYFATGDASAEGIDAFLTSQGSPMAGSGILFMTSGQRWGIDPRLVVAIAGAESSFGQQLCAPHNAWGWGCPNGPYDFDSWGEGIETVTKYLRLSYIDEGYTTVAKIQTKYAPSGAANDPTNLNNHWVANVSKFLVAQGGNPNGIILSPTSGGFAGSSPLG
jgi:hypothetical protein